MSRGIQILILFILVSVTPLAQRLESSMVLHVLIQIPVLIVLGYLLGAVLRKNLNLAPFLKIMNYKGVPGILLASLSLAFWMLPKVLDSSLTEPGWTLLKYTSVPLLIGLPLALSWHLAGPIIRALVKIELLTMLLRLGWVYMISPVRLCNLYHLNEQLILGQYLLAIAFVIAIYWTIQLFAADYSSKLIKAIE